MLIDVVMKRFNIRLQPIMSLTDEQLCGFEVLSEPPSEVNMTEWFERCSTDQLLQLRKWQLMTLAKENLTVKLFINVTTAILASEEGATALLQDPLPGVIELQDPVALARLDAPDSHSWPGTSNGFRMPEWKSGSTIISVTMAISLQPAGSCLMGLSLITPPSSSFAMIAHA
jgi:hypothetical protein